MVLSLLGAGEQINSSLGDGQALFAQVSNLAQIATSLVQELRNSHDVLAAAGVSDSEASLRANLLSGAISDVLESLKVCFCPTFSVFLLPPLSCPI